MMILKSGGWCRKFLKPTLWVLGPRMSLSKPSSS